MNPTANRHQSAQERLEKNLPELLTLERLIRAAGDRAEIHTETVVEHEGIEFPLYSMVIGSKDDSAPTLGVFAGVHGLERIGTQVVLAWLQTVLETMAWDESFQERLTRSRLVVMPIINPTGMYLTRRANRNGVDLMRNAPVVADERPAFLLGGQSYTRHLPWFRGNPEILETETKAVATVVEREVFPAQTSLTVDVHSGFGSVDRLWFPYARTCKPPPHLAEIVALKRLFDRTYPNHFYRIEPQAEQYTTHGDLWDWLFDRQLAVKPEHVYLPFTLELGSWLWVRKNPRNLFSSLGAFHPTQPHRVQRVLRRHLTLFDFLHRAVLNPRAWVEPDGAARRALEKSAIEKWYDGKKN